MNVYFCNKITKYIQYCGEAHLLYLLRKKWPFLLKGYGV